MSDAFAIHRTMMAVEKLLAATPSWGSWRHSSRNRCAGRS